MPREATTRKRGARPGPRKAAKAAGAEPKPVPPTPRRKPAAAKPAPEAPKAPAIEPPAPPPPLVEAARASAAAGDATAAPPLPPARERRSAAMLARGQREISVSEFFAKNRHLLGFDSPVKALLTAVKEAVDNALDACEEGGILPSVRIEIAEIVPNARYRIAVEDNGPGIVKGQIPRIFGKLFYGSKFHHLKQSRGQQGIGISAAGLYGLLTTGKPVVITSRTGKGKPARHFELTIDTKHNEPHVIVDTTVPNWPAEHGTRVEIELEGSYRSGRRSIDEYIEQTALANPHAEFCYRAPRGREPVHLARVVEALPPEPHEIKPHPYGVELGVFLRMAHDARGRSLSAFLTQDFSRVSPRTAASIAAAAGLVPRARAGTLAPAEIERLYAAIQSAKLIAPSVRSVVPIGEKLVRKGLEREAPNAGLYVTRTRPPRVYRGNPFVVEVGLAYGGELTGVVDHLGAGPGGGAGVGGIVLAPERRVDQGLLAIPGMSRSKAQEICHKAHVEPLRKAATLAPEEIERLRHAIDADLRADAASRPIELVRLANRVPLLYQQSACAITQAVIDTNWKRYGLLQPRGGLPCGPMVLVVHIASVWVPFTSESKEAIAHYPEIIEEIQRGLQECGRQLGAYLSRRAFARVQAARRDKIGLYAGELIEALHALTGRPRERIGAALEAAQKSHMGAEEAEVGEEEEEASTIEARGGIRPEEGNGGNGGEGEGDS